MGEWEPVVGMLVCTCRLRHVRIESIDDDGDTIITEDGWRCSFHHCCDPADHTWTHDEIRREVAESWP